ncbi:MAG: glutamate racemase [Candidatus Kapabacteria bacterium]|nr:glutamate racemase [Candidatus Kapabacteria bacterium]
MRRIGVFDSGIGGLTVVRHIIPYAAGCELLYVGDTARVPYGNRGPEAIRQYARELTLYLCEQEVELIVVACNTVSAVALEVVQAHSPVPVIDVVEPTVELTLRQTTEGRIGIIGTRATIASGIYERLLRQRSEWPLEIYGKACPLFVPLVEEGWIESPVTEQIAEFYLAPLREAGIDTLVLGCTHYPLLVPVLQRVLPDCRLVESGAAVAERLQALGYASDQDGGAAQLVLHLTDEPGEALKHLLRRLQLVPADVRSIRLWEYV